MVTVNIKNMDQEKKETLINDIKTQLDGLLEAKLSKDMRKKAKMCLEELKKAMDNKDTLLNVLEVFDRLGLVDIPDNFRETVNNSVETLKEDFEFWTELGLSVMGQISDLEEKLKNNTGCFAAIKKLLSKLKK